MHCLLSLTIILRYLTPTILKTATAQPSLPNHCLQQLFIDFLFCIILVHLITAIQRCQGVYVLLPSTSSSRLPQILWICICIRALIVDVNARIVSYTFVVSLHPSLKYLYQATAPAFANSIKMNMEYTSSDFSQVIRIKYLQPRQVFIIVKKVDRTLLDFCSIASTSGFLVSLHCTVRYDLFSEQLIYSSSSLL